MWMPRGEQRAIPAPGTNQKVPIYGALNYRTNRLRYRVGERKNTAECLGFLAQLAEEQGNRPTLLVWDNASYHTAAAVRAFLADLAPNIQAIWLPPYSPELNEIERLWKYLKGASLANYDFGNVATLRLAIEATFQTFHQEDTHDPTLKYRDPLAKNLLKIA